MNKIDSPSSNNSRTSSETSETQSIEENIQAGGNQQQRTKAPQSSSTSVERSGGKSKRMKEGNNDKEPEKRPPWRAVSISTLPKPDKNALLKAKLLDASRRMRAGKSSISVQTDIVPTKLMKEVNLGVQVDLILLREAGVMTDGAYMKKKQGTDEFILTYAVSTLTDAIRFADVATQTLLPKIPEDKLMIGSLQCDMNSEEFSKVQRKLTLQIEKLKNASNHKSSIIDSFQTENFEEENENPEFCDNFSRHSSLKGETLKYWHFDLDECGSRNVDFQPYTISANRPWKSFVPLSYDGLYCKNSGRPQWLDWNILFSAIDELIQESNYLVDMIEDLSRTKIVTVEIPKFDPRSKQLPSDNWLPIIEQQEEKLKAMKENMRSSSP